MSPQSQYPAPPEVLIYKIEIEPCLILTPGVYYSYNTSVKKLFVKYTLTYYEIISIRTMVWIFMTENLRTTRNDEPEMNFW